MRFSLTAFRLGGILVLSVLCLVTPTRAQNVQLLTSWNSRESEPGDNQRFVQATTILIQREPNEYRHYYNRGVTYNCLLQADKAIADFNAVLALNPNISRVLWERAEAYRIGGYYDKALADYRRYYGYQNKPITDVAFPTEAISPRRNRFGQRPFADSDGYVQSLEKIIFNPTPNRAISPDLLLELGSLHFQRREYESAAKSWQAYQEIRAKDQPVIVLGSGYTITPSFLLETGRQSLRIDTAAQKLRDALDKHLETTPNDPIALLCRGALRIHIGQHTQALLDLHHLIEIDKKNGPAYFNRGVAYLALKEGDNAARDFEKAKHLLPPYAYVDYVQGLAYEMAKDKRKALNAYKRYVAAEPDGDFVDEAKERIKVLGGG
jgi:tetratricopeptide (TPR) repeat protein